MTRSNVRTVYTPKAVSRPTGNGYTYLAIRADYDERRDLFSFRVDGDLTEWHRRGQPMFATWVECCAFIRSQGWPCNG